MDDIDWSALTAKLPTGRDTAATLRRAELFDRFDINGNGVLSLAEVDKAMRDVMGLDSVYSSKPVIMRAFQAARDHNGHKKTTAKRKGADDYVERDEFRTLLVYLRQYFELYVAFNRLDLNNDDRVDVCEFRNSLETLGKWGIEITPEQAEEEFAKIDLNGGGAVLFDEFCHWAISKNLDLEDDDDFDDAAVDGQDGHLKRHARKAAAAGAKAKEVQTSKWQNKGSKQIAEANLVHAKIISASQGREDAARERLVRLRARAQRELTRAAAVAATEQQRERRRQAVAQVRAETDQMIGRDVTARVRDVPDLSKEELFTLSELFNTQLQKATKGDNARTFFQLFKDLDIDGSRRIGFNELERMVRGKLHLSERRLEQQKLYGLWKNLDENKSGYIDTGELSRFLRIGAPKTLTAVQRARLKLQASRNGRMARIRAEVDKEQEKDVVNKLDEVEKATDEEVQQFGFLFHKQLAILRPRGQDNISFYGLFKRMDVDASGRVNFDEFKRMIRLGMQVDAKELPEKTMWGLWKVIDENANGFICGGEFARFMRLASEQAEQAALGQTLNSQQQNKAREDQAWAQLKREETWARQTADSASATAKVMEAEAARLEALLGAVSKQGISSEVAPTRHMTTSKSVGGLMGSRSSASLVRASAKADIGEGAALDDASNAASPEPSPTKRMEMINMLAREMKGGRVRVHTNGSLSVPMLLPAISKEEGNWR